MIVNQKRKKEHGVRNLKTLFLRVLKIKADFEDAEIPLPQFLGLGYFPGGYGDHFLEDSFPRLLYRFLPLDDLADFKIDVIFHLAASLGIATDLDHGGDG